MKADNILYPRGIVTPGVQPEMTRPQYWINRTNKAHDIIMSLQQIRYFNREIINRVESVCDLLNHKDILDKNELTGRIKAYKTPEKNMYNARGEKIGRGFYHQLITNLNLEQIRESNRVEWGITIKNTSIRSFPEAEGVFDQQCKEFDRFQETGLQACEPVAVLHRSADRGWFFVQAYYYCGWAPAKDIALVENPKVLFAYVNSPDFLVVTANWVKSWADPKHLVSEFDMGTRLPLFTGYTYDTINCSINDNYNVRLPQKDRNGFLKFTRLQLPATEDVTYGYLPFTRANIISQAFKLQADRYDWGNKNKGRDCSSYIQVIFRTFGFNLPRNAGDQAKVPGRVISFNTGDSLEKRSTILDRFEPGAIIFMPGHVMLYLGKVNGCHYIIHDFSCYGQKNNTGYSIVPVYQVAVTSTLLPSQSGEPFMAKFTSMIQLEY